MALYVASSFGYDGWGALSGVLPGDLLLAVMSVSAGAAITDPNGYTQDLQGSPITRLGRPTYGPWTYHLEVWSRRAPASGVPVPTLAAGAGQTGCGLVAFRGASSVTHTWQGTAGDAGSSIAEPAGRSTLRVWSAIGNEPVITPSNGVVRQARGGSTFDVATVLVTDTEETVTASVQPGLTVGWLAATIGLGYNSTRPDTHPTRLYPRDDGRGHSSARRIYPPPKAGRIVGGYR